MALGTNYQRNGYGKFGKAVKERIQRHTELMNRYIAEGMDRESASRMAYDDIVNGGSKQ